MTDEKQKRLDANATAAMQCISGGQTIVDPQWAAKKAYDIAEQMELERELRMNGGSDD